jgi:hypothetical protein
VLIIKDKSGCGDEEMLRFIRRNTLPGDSICVASGDRDFSSLLVEYVHNSYNVFLVYNKQAIHTLKHNHHWLGSIDCRRFITTKPKISNTPKHVMTKPCKFYNLDRCNAVSCSFLHQCGICGRPHKSQDFHPGHSVLKSTVCKKYNAGFCSSNRVSCEHLHICSKCKKPHSYLQCKSIVMYCPLCNCQMNSTEKYVEHHISEANVKKMMFIKTILKPNTPKHVLIV